MNATLSTTADYNLSHNIAVAEFVPLSMYLKSSCNSYYQKMTSSNVLYAFGMHTCINVQCDQNAQSKTTTEKKFSNTVHCFTNQTPQCKIKIKNCLKNSVQLQCIWRKPKHLTTSNLCLKYNPPPPPHTHTHLPKATHTQFIGSTICLIHWTQEF